MLTPLPPGVFFRTELNSGLLDGTDRGRERLLMQVSMKRFGEFPGSSGRRFSSASEGRQASLQGNVLRLTVAFLRQV